MFNTLISTATLLFFFHYFDITGDTKDIQPMNNCCHLSANILPEQQALTLSLPKVTVSAPGRVPEATTVAHIPWLPLVTIGTVFTHIKKNFKKF